MQGRTVNTMAVMSTQHPTPDPAGPGGPGRLGPSGRPGQAGSSDGSAETVSFVKPSAAPGADSWAAPSSAKAAEPIIEQAGTGATALMLARYLVGRALAARLSLALWLVAGIIFVGAIALWIVDAHWVAVLFGLLGLLVLGVRALVMFVLRKVMAVGRLGSAEARITELVRDTGADLRRELRRIGLPGSVFAMPVLLVRILGKRRKQTFQRLREFDVTNVVPASRRAELDFLVRNDVLNIGPRRERQPGGTRGFRRR